MGKRIFKITDVSGGINENNARDIKDNELADANCIDVTVQGIIRPALSQVKENAYYSAPDTTALDLT